ncbi:MAG: hypothetical protein WCR06_01330 [bacterium]
MRNKRILLAGLLAPLLIAGCLVSRGPRGEGITIVPILPALVVLDAEPYYVHEGYHYHYRNGGWFYAQSRSGPWVSLPRDHYPKEVRFRDMDNNRGQEQKRKHESEHQER